MREVRDERELVRRCREGSEAAFAELVRSHRPRLYRGLRIIASAVCGVVCVLLCVLGKELLVAGYSSVWINRLLSRQVSGWLPKTNDTR